ncbi:30S ribosomal protein S2 [Candidatus Woesearchaeota archaeon]|nr:30S ribosomal protein S2 [Candidatus Woesearchaeota archaeon]MBW3017194.1 30S ribosomal protein S2 [Candidatus Woesearchaeota archaeon]
MAEQESLLVASDVYFKAGTHIGTKFKTKYMKQFIYKSRPDGLSVLNLQLIDKRVAMAARMLSPYDAKDILVVCRRENGWEPVKLFGKATGAKVVAGRYPPGILTNQQLANFIEAKVIVVTDPIPDVNAIKDALNVGIPIIALCDTNNEAVNLDFVIPCNNKGRRSLGLVFYLIAREYLRNKGLLKADEELPIKIEEFMGD